MTQVYRILYCSRNTLKGSLKEQRDGVQQILQSSRENNSRANITGALLFSAGYFAQVLEGPLNQVEQTFEKIQRDMRHDEVAVLESGYVQKRDFPEWSMAFAGSPAEQSVVMSGFDFPRTLEDRTTAANEIGELLRSLVLQDDDHVAA